MAMFLNGLEESPGKWAGWTFSGVAACGHHLYLSGGGQNDLSSLANWDAGTLGVISIVQKFSSSDGGAIGTKTYPSPVTSGNMIVVAAATWTNHITSITDNAAGGSNKYIKAGSIGTGQYTVEFWIAINVRGPATSGNLALTFVGGSSGSGTTFFEIAGADKFHPLFGISTNSGTSSTPTSNALTAPVDGCLSIGLFSCGGSPTSYAAGSGWNVQTNVPSDANDNNFCETRGDNTVIAAGSVSATCTLGASKDYAAAMIVILPSGGNKGTPPTVEGARFRVTDVSRLFNDADFSINGNFDLRVDFDAVHLGADADIGLVDRFKLGVMLDDQKFSHAEFSSNVGSPTFGIDIYYSDINLGDHGDAETALPGTMRYGSIRLARSGNDFSAYFWNPYSQSWSAPATTTQSFATLARGVAFWMKQIPSGVKAYFQNVRNVVPTVTSGTATSPVFDTVDGFQGLGWFTDGAGTGTVLLEYRVGQTSGACSAASYQTATNWLPVMPSASNRYVQVRMTISGGSTTAPSPEVGPILVNGSLDLPTSTLMWKRYITSLCRHTNSLNQICQGEAASNQGAYWSRPTLGLGRWVAANGGSLTFEGTTWDIATQCVNGLVTTLTDNTNGFGNSVQLRVEASYTVFPGLVAGWSVLGPLFSGTAKANITTNVNSKLGLFLPSNGDAQALTCRQAMTALWNMDTPQVSGHWDSTTPGVPWADADSDDNIVDIALVSQGQGFFADNVFGHTDDSYSMAFDLWFAMVLAINPSYSHASTIRTYTLQGDRSYRQLADIDGNICSHGRSMQGVMWTYGGLLATLNAETNGGRYDLARGLAGRGVWAILRYNYQPGVDFTTPTLGRLGNTSSLDPLETTALMNGELCNNFGVFATSASLYSVAPTPHSGASAGVTLLTGPADAIVYGGGPADPQIQCHGTCKDDTNASSKYAARIHSGHFGRNYGQSANTHAPCQNGSGFYWHDSALDSGNICYVHNTIGNSQAIHLGRAAVVWRSGTPSQFSSVTDAGDASGCTGTEIYYLRGHHVVANAKVALAADGRTMSNFGWASPPIPLANGDALNNIATTTNTAYAEAPAYMPEQLSVFVKGLTSNLQGTGVPFVGRNFLAGDPTLSYPLTASMVDYWKMDEASGNRVSSTRNNPASPSGTGIGSATGQVSNCVTLDGTAGTYLSLSSYPLAGCTDFSYLGRMFWNDSGNGARWERVWDFGTGQTAYAMLTAKAGGGTNTDCPRYAITTSGSAGEQIVTSSRALTPQTWTHLAVVREGNTTALFFNGIAGSGIGSNTIYVNNSQTISPSGISSPGNLYFGKSQYSDPYLKGSLDEQAFLSRTISPPEFLAHLAPSTYPTFGGGIGWKRWRMWTFYWDPAALFTTNDTLKTLDSDDGVTWRELPVAYLPATGTSGGATVSDPTVRDPDVLPPTATTSANGYYWMVHTNGAGTKCFTVARSKTGLVWEPACIVDCSAFTGANNVWAPGWAIDPADGSVHVLVAIQNAGGSFTICEVHPTASDWTNASNWSSPSAVGGLSGNLIDAEFQYVAGDPKPYRIWFTPQPNGYLGYAKSASLTSGYSIVHDGSTDWLSIGYNAEGPAMVKKPDGSWRLYFDKPGDTTGDYRYIDSLVADFSTPSAVSNVSTSSFLGGSYALHHGRVLYLPTPDYTSVRQANILNYGGAGVDVTNTSDTPSGTIRAAAEFALRHTAMSPSGEAAYSANYTWSGDDISFDADAAGTLAKVYAHSGSGFSGTKTIGNYSVVATALKAFSGTNTSPDDWGGSALTSVSHNGTPQASLQTAGNLSVVRQDAATTYVEADQGDVTVYAACLPVQFNKVYAFDVFETAIDVTSSCTVTSGASVVIPSGVVSTYKSGVAKFAVVRDLGVIPMSTPFGAFFDFSGGFGS